MTNLTNSPWGRIQHKETLAEGIVSVSTASHGGIWLSNERLKQLPDELHCNPYGGDRWFEEDLEASIIILYFLDEMPKRYQDYFSNAKNKQAAIDYFKPRSLTSSYASVYNYFMKNLLTMREK